MGRVALVAALIGAGALAFASGATSAVGELPETIPVPPARPAVGELLASVPNTPTPRPGKKDTDTEPEVGMPQSERACRARLIVLGVEFAERDRIDGEGECGITFPIEVESLGDGVELTPGGVMNCDTALAAAQVVQQTVKPTAERELNGKLVGVRHASAYVCRHRWNGEKVSEHARGNALDISAFLLEDGREVAVQAYGPEHKPENRFFSIVRRAACGPFKTVLGPGTDADHETHFHFDLAERRAGSTYCR